jgi:hypothetical protein
MSLGWSARAAEAALQAAASFKSESGDGGSGGHAAATIEHHLSDSFTLAYYHDHFVNNQNHMWWSL